MAFTSINTGLIAVGKALTNALMTMIKDNFDALNGTVETLAAGLKNGSFEIDSDADGIPDTFTRTVYAGGSVARTAVAAEVMHGEAALKFTHPGGAGNGGGSILSDYMPVSSFESVFATFLRKMSIASRAGFKHRVRLHWYDAAKVALAPAGEGTSYTTAIDSVHCHTDAVMVALAIPAIAGARFVRIEWIGGVTDTDVAGSMILDGGSTGRSLPDLTRVENTVDNFVSIASRGGAVSAAWTDLGAAINFDLRPFVQGVPIRLTIPIQLWCTSLPGAYFRWRLTADRDGNNVPWVGEYIELDTTAPTAHDSVIEVPADLTGAILSLTPQYVMDNAGDTMTMAKTADESIRYEPIITARSIFNDSGY